MRKAKVDEAGRRHREQDHDQTVRDYMCRSCPENLEFADRVADMTLKLQRPWWVPQWWPLSR